MSRTARLHRDAHHTAVTFKKRRAIVVPLPDSAHYDARKESRTHFAPRRKRPKHAKIAAYSCPMLLERQMEELIAANPDDFFPGRGFVLRDRQKSFAGVGRFDLLFVDRYSTTILMELKAVPARYENASQLAKYKDALEAKGERDIMMWLVAPDIPRSVREFLDRIGIEYSEIHEAEFRRVAARHGVEIEVARPPLANERKPTETARVVARSGAFNVPLTHDFDRTTLERLIAEFEAAAKRRIDKSLATRLRAELLNGPVTNITKETAFQLARWCNTANPLYWDGMEVAKKISVLLFDKVLDRHELGT